MTTSTIQTFEQRKKDHIEFALRDKNQGKTLDLEKLTLIHEALPDLDFAQCDMTVNSLGSEFKTPFFVSSMTAGHSNANNINHGLAEACQQTGWAMGVGSQRRQLFDAEAANEWKSIKQANPAVHFYGNIGVSQLITYSIDAIKKLCESIEAKALFIHCNPLQECIQPEGTPQFSGAYKAIETLCQQLQLPVIIKETGCGFSKNTLAHLNDCGIAAVDVSGFGGTHWGRIEGDRTINPIVKSTAETFSDWGISTLQSILNAKEIQPHFEIWASGGVRSGLDAAKYLALGATRVGIAKPMLEAALINVTSIIELMHCFEYQLKTALFCTGSINIAALRETHRWQLTI